LRRARVSTELASDLLEAVEAASRRPGRIATLIVPHDLQLDEGVEVGGSLTVPASPTVAAHRIDEAAAEAATGRFGRDSAGGASAAGAVDWKLSRGSWRAGRCASLPGLSGALGAGAGTPQISRLPYFRSRRCRSSRHSGR
jgi:hypothetical protein